ncbi:MAG: TerB family tellurite resistance protein [Oceanococcaceae bacterium]
MLNQWLKKVLHDHDGADGADGSDNALCVQLASAVLLVDVARADWEDDPRERAVMIETLRNHFDLTEAEAGELLTEAELTQDREVSLHGFLSRINEVLAPAEKRALLDRMWQVAFADGELAPYEEHTIRRLADLLYLPHEDFIRGKLAAQPQEGHKPSSDRRE